MRSITIDDLKKANDVYYRTGVSTMFHHARGFHDEVLRLLMFDLMEPSTTESRVHPHAKCRLCDVTYGISASDLVNGKIINRQLVEAHAQECRVLKLVTGAFHSQLTDKLPT